MYPIPVLCFLVQLRTHLLFPEDIVYIPLLQD